MLMGMAYMGEQRVVRGPAVLALAVGAAVAGSALAQDMDEGEARVRSRSDVEMRVESGPATNSERLARLAGSMGPALGRIKRCYAEILEERPMVEGVQKLSVSLPERGKVRVKITTDGVEDRGVRRCVLGAIRGVSYDGVPRPANAYVELTFTHSAAAGTAASRERSRATDAVVEMNADGLPETSFSTPREQIRYTVVGKRKDDAERVVAARAGLRAAVPTLLDCRRRAARRDRSPEGDVTLEMRVSRGGRARARAVASSVGDRRASACVARAIARARFDREAAGRVRVVVHFFPYAKDDG